MKHYSPETWADFVRGVAATHEQAEMEAHLNTRCEACNTTVGWMRHVQQLAKVDQSTDVPAEPLNAARRIFHEESSKRLWNTKLPNTAA